MGATRRKFSREFKLEAVRQLEAGRRLAEVARSRGSRPTWSGPHSTLTVIATIHMRIGTSSNLDSTVQGKNALRCDHMRTVGVVGRRVDHSPGGNHSVTYVTPFL